MAIEKQLESILTNLLWSRVKAEDAPCSSDQHLCDAIAQLISLLPDYKPSLECQGEYDYVLKSKQVLDSPHVDRDRLEQWIAQTPHTPFTGFKKQ